MKKKFTFLTAVVMLLAFLAVPLGMRGQTRDDFEGTFTRISSTDDFVTGYYVITASQSASNKTYALGSTVNSKKRIEGVPVSISTNAITDPANNLVYYVTVNENTCTFRNVSTNKYLSQASTTSGQGMGFSSTSTNITLDSYSSSAPIGFKFLLNGASNNKLMWNNSSKWFANYGSDYNNGQTPVELFKLESGGSSVAAPTFSPGAGTYYEAQNVTIACETEGATLHYKLTENGEWQPYTSAIPVTETTTIWAKATLGDASSEASATYTFPITIAAVRAQGTGNVFTKGIITYISSKNAYIQDATAAICVYGSSSSAWNNFAIGDEIAVSGELTTYNAGGNMLEIQNPSATKISQNNPLPSVTKTIAEINTDAFTDLQCMHVKIEDATVTEKDGSNTTISQTVSSVTSTILVYSSNFDVEEGDVITSFYSNVGYYEGLQLVNPTEVQTQQPPTITTNAVNNSLAVPNQILGSYDATGFATLTVNGANLTEGITLTLGTDSPFEMSTDLDNWSSTTVTIPETSSSVTDEQVAIRLRESLTTVQEYSDNVTLASSGAQSVTVALTGSVTNQTYTLTDESGVNGSISFSASTAEAGAHVTLTATPTSDAYYFVPNSWSFFKDDLTDVTEDIEFVSGESNVIVMPAYNLHVDASFQLKQTYTITALAEPTEGGTVVTDDEAWEGKTVEIAVQANNGYVLSNLTATYVDGNSETQNLTITNNTFMMPAFAVTVTATFAEYHAYVIDFEDETTTYADWTFSNMTSKGTNTNVTAHGGSYFGTTGGKATASIVTKNKIASPQNLTCYVSKQSTNTTSSTWKIQVSENGTSWTDVKSQDATTMDAGVWVEFTANLSAYSNVYVRVFYTGSTAVRCIDDLSLTYTPAASYALSVASVDHATITATVGSATIDEDTSSDVESGLMVTLAATPDENYQFAAWSVYKTGNPETTVEVNANNQFEMPAYPVTVSASFNETCTLTKSVNGHVSNEVAVKGTDITLTDPTTNIPVGFDFIGWTSNPANVADADLVTSLIMNANATVYAVFGKSNTLTLTSAGLPTGYDSEEKEYTLQGVKFGVAKTMANSNRIQMQSGNGYIYNKDAFNGLVSIVATQTGTHRDATLKIGSSMNPNEGTVISPSTSGMVDTYDLSSYNDEYIWLKNTSSNALYYSSIVFTFSNTDPARYTRVFLNETAEANITIAGPSIIPSGQTLAMGTYTLTSTTAANLFIEEGGQLIHNNDGVMATMKKHINGYTSTNDNYYLIASPIAIEPENVTNMLSNNYDLYYFASWEPGEEWQNYKSDLPLSAFIIQPGQGYLYANNTDTDIVFAGEVNPSSDNDFYYGGLFVESSSDPFNGWSLAGNPFACNAYPVLNNGTAASFYKINGDELEVSTENFMRPLEGIFIQETDEETMYYFNRTAPISLGKGPSLNLTVFEQTTTRGNAKQDVARIRFDKGNSLEKFQLNPEHMKIFIPQNGKDYAVVVAEARGEMPVNFKAAKNGTYTISVETENLEVSYLHLIDHMTGENVDLLQTPSYTFTGKTSDYASRFRLVFNANNLNENDSDEPFAFISNDNIVVMNEGEATLQVIDMLGRVIETKTLNGNATIGTQANGVYVLRLINGDNVKTQKIVVK